MKTMLLLPIAAIALLACQDSPPPKPSTSSVSPTALSAPPAASSAAPVPDKAVLPEATLDGKKLTLEHAIAFSSGGDSIWVWLSNQPLACQDVPASYFDVRDGETRVQLTFARGYAIPQTASWVVRRLMVQRTATIRAEVQPAKGAMVVVERADANAALNAKLNLRADAPGLGEFALTGQLVALGCGLRSPKTQAAPRLQEKLDVKVANQPVVLRGARLTGSALEPTKLELSTAPLDPTCGISSPLQADLDIVIDLSGQPPKSNGAIIDGLRFPAQTLTPSGAMTVALLPPSDGDVPVEVTFKYRGMRISGVAQAQVCTPASPKP